VQQAVIGIDPGKSGAVCLLEIDTQQTYFLDWPKDDDEQVVCEQLAEWKMTYDIVLVALEKVASMRKGEQGPKQGVASAFTFGQNYGTWRGFLVALTLPFTNPRPKAWQKGLVVISKGQNPKDATFTVARQRFPTAELKGPRGGVKFGRTDACVIALHALRTWRNGG
jgi:hypothetical protein